jgi:hypothetical protein
MKKDSLIKKWEGHLKALINPDGMKEWSDLGFDNPPDGYKSVDDFLENDPEAEWDAEHQVEMRVVKEFLDDLRNLPDEGEEDDGGSDLSHMPERVLRGNVRTFRKIFHGDTPRFSAAIEAANGSIEAWQNELKRRGLKEE